MDPETKPAFNPQISEEAAEWFLEFRSGDVTIEARRGFSEWLRLSPEHLRAYLEVAAIWEEGAVLDVQRRHDVEALIALANAEENVVPLSAATANAPAAAGRRGWPAHSVRRLAIAASLFVVAVSLFGLLFLNQGEYSTGIGEQRTLALADGSMVQLNTRSRIRERYSDQERAIDLLEGQALFQVARDTERPFIVRVDGALIRAVGTQFDVYRRREGATVTVLEGRVEIQAPEGNFTPRMQARTDGERAGGGRGMFLNAGQQLTVTPDMEPEPATVNITVATAWTQRRLIFESATLSEVAEEFNRYNRVQITLMDDDVVDFHISGVYSSTDPGSLVRFLQARRGIEVVEAGDEIRISRP
jgi:transmembrane sensor